MMRTGLMQSASNPGPGAPVSAQELFRARFQRSLRNCVRRRFSVAECFGVIWLETLEEVALTEPDQAELYDELIHWAKDRLFAEVIHSSSRPLFAIAMDEFKGFPDGLNPSCPV
jgi:hypothetical protein